MRLAYIDEAGISNPTHEPFLVVAAPIIHGDWQLDRVERYIRAIGVNKLPPEMRRAGFAFHATDLFSGVKRFRDRDEWPRERRWGILDLLCEIPSKFKIPIAFGAIDRARFSKSPPEVVLTARDPVPLDVAEYATAFLGCAMWVERWMRDEAPDENAMLIAEDKDRVRQFIRKTHAALQERRIRDDSPPPELGDLLPFRRIKDTVHFASKQESPALQLADLCAFVIKRKIMGKLDIERFYEPIMPQLLWRPSGTPMGMTKEEEGRLSVRTIHSDPR